ncbi:hypothetical protein N1851_034112 [Merluccius polli]|uniref:Uncharacterized protein n=1 Tax=Merluccius polli TaxID=89951 RepID=A0AA47M070_MERPO|nr:hypothetical protein N1851_034112 [Merluccius polli]
MANLSRHYYVNHKSASEGHLALKLGINIEDIPLNKRLTDFLLGNSYIDTLIQKGGIPKVPGCLEHTGTVTQQIREGWGNKTCTRLKAGHPWEDRIEEANERKRVKYAELVEQCRSNGWRVEM